MLKVKTPKEYYCESGILSKSGEIISGFGREAFIIAGKKAYDSVKDILEESLKDEHIGFSLNIMEGYPTYDKVKAYSIASYEKKADIIISIGGGKICDTAKGVANMRNIPVVMIPTVAGTCACWAARSILYTDDGNFDRALWNENNPDIIIADTDILKNSPKRYLAAGILDTLAKWYEFEPLIERDKKDVVLRQDVAIAKLAFDILEELGLKAYRGEADDDELRQVLDAIFFLAGASGSFANGKAYRGFAHSYYYASTRVKESRYQLHGEKVAFGLLVQFVLKEKPAEYIDKFIRDLKNYEITDIPGDWSKGNPEITKETVEKIAGLIIKESPIVVEKGLVGDEAQCAKAIERASELLGSAR
ncbi:MAG: iron-containing alcohol dehydrogenase family protein [Lachnospiraceae bacterium]|nr:iron-containing alcohol dehydrogenase family protein [Lachnospiraceae bacterium]